MYRMNQESITEELNKLYNELMAEYKNLLEQVMATMNLENQRADVLNHLKSEIQDNSKLKLEEFKKGLSGYLLKFLLMVVQRSYGNHPDYNINNMQSLKDLMQKSFFPTEDMTINRNHLLSELVKLLNEKIKIFYYHRKDRMEPLIRKQDQHNQEEVQKPPPKPKLNDFQACLCKDILVPRVQEFKLIPCQVCKVKYHDGCLKVPENEVSNFVCPKCTIENLDHFAQVVKAICAPRFFQFERSQKNQYTFQFNPPDVGKGQQIQIRCLRVDGNHGLDESTWPDAGELRVNGQRLYDFKPLQLNTALKKRKDNIIQLKERITQTNVNFVTIMEAVSPESEKALHRIAENQIHYAGIFIVQPYTVKELLTNLKKDKQFLLPDEQGRELIKEKQNELTKNVEGLMVEKLKISIVCQYSLARIETPARGSLCNHVNCFSLENLIAMTYSQIPRKWRCPICKNKLIKIIIDEYQRSIIEKMTQSNIQDNNVTFNENGEVEGNQNYKGEDQSSSSHPQPERQSPQSQQKSPTNPQQAIMVIEDDEGIIIDAPKKKIKTFQAPEYIELD